MLQKTISSILQKPISSFYRKQYIFFFTAKQYLLFTIKQYLLFTENNSFLYRKQLHSSKSGLKTHGVVRGIPKQIKKTLRESDIYFSSTLWNSTPDPPDPPDPADQVSGAVARNLPLTGARDQDGGSLHKLPQIKHRGQSWSWIVELLDSVVVVNVKQSWIAQSPQSWRDSRGPWFSGTDNPQESRFLCSYTIDIVIIGYW